MITFKTLTIEKGDGISRIRLNRPEKLNTINKEMMLELKAALEDASEDKMVKVVVITGTGRAFCAGADVSIFKDASPIEVRSLLLKGIAGVIRAIMELEKPVVAAVNGLALGGGCELVLACDMIIATENAFFGQTEINLGVLPGWGGMSRLAQVIGLRKATELVLTGNVINANEAERLGLVNKVVPADKLWETLNEVVGKLLDKSSLALKLAKEAIRRGVCINAEAALSSDLDALCSCLGTIDAKEGIASFLEKRKPVFKGI